MSLNLNPVSLGVRENFRPFQDSVASSFTLYLPFGTPARYLSLDGCDIRKILYAIYSEKGNGHERTFDLTFCEQEPAILARTMMLLSIILYGKFDSEDEKNSIAWNVVHDIYLGEKSLAAIESQSEILLTLSKSLETWSTSSFGQIFRIVNVETLETCREIWKLYHDYATSPTTHRPLLNKVVQTMSSYEKYWRLAGKDPEASSHVPPMTASFGLSVMKSERTAVHLINRYWDRGVTDPADVPVEKFLNPMLLYTRSAKDKFVIDRKTSPLSIYHLREAVEGFDKVLDGNMAKAVASAKSQFRDWCVAFRQFIGISEHAEQLVSDKIVIRFAVGDPIAFCLAIQQAFSTSITPFNNGLSDTWSGTPLVINRDSVPAEFNTIETATLVDSIGCINILLGTVPLLQAGPASTLTTESCSRPYSEETALLKFFLCQQPAFMYTVFGIAPLAQLTGVSTTGLLQDTLELLDFSGDRPGPVHTKIVWKSTWAADSNVTELPRISFEKPMYTPFQARPPAPSDELFHLLFRISGALLSRGHEAAARANQYGVIYRRQYTPAAFAAFVAFLKTRVSTNVDEAMDELCQKLDPFDGMDGHMQDLMWQLHLSGAFVSSGWDVVQRIPRVQDLNPAGKVLTLADRPAATCVVLTVPRGKLAGIYEKIVRQGTASCSFEIRHKASEIGKSSSYYSIIPVFGQLIVNEDGLTGRIEADKAGWHGTSDLQVCAYLPTHNLCMPVSKARRTHVSFAMYKDRATLEAFMGSYGKDLEIFDALLSDTNHVHCLKSVEGFEQPVRPATITVPESKWMHDDDNGKIKAPMLLLRDGHGSFSTQIFPGKGLASREFWKHNPVIVRKKTSPCTITVEYGPISHTVQFPYPVVASKASLNTIKPLRTIELDVPLCDPESFLGGYYDNFLPISRNNETNTVCGWNLPFVNLSNLRPLKDGLARNGTLFLHTFQMLSDRESQDGARFTEDLVEFKKTQQLILRDITAPPVTPKVIGITHCGQMQYLFFVTDIFMDDASHTIVAEAFFFESTPEHRAKRGATLSTSKLDVETYEVSSKQLEMWKQFIPAMAERCRTWDHKTDHCEYSSGGAKLTDVCSCGKGLTNATFDAQTEWNEFAAEVVRCAISPIFPAPFIENSRQETLQTIDKAFGSKKLESAEDGSCSHCKGTGKMKKCAKCSNAYYCNKECQKADWKRHKKACRLGK